MLRVPCLTRLATEASATVSCKPRTWLSSQHPVIRAEPSGRVNLDARRCCRPGARVDVVCDVSDNAVVCVTCDCAPCATCFRPPFIGQGLVDACVSCKHCATLTWLLRPVNAPNHRVKMLKCAVTLPWAWLLDQCCQGETWGMNWRSSDGETRTVEHPRRARTVCDLRLRTVRRSTWYCAPCATWL